MDNVINGVEVLRIQDDEFIFSYENNTNINIQILND